MPAAGWARKTPQGFQGSKGHHPVEKWWLITLFDLCLSRAVERDGARHHCSQIITGGSVTYWVRCDRACSLVLTVLINKRLRKGMRPGSVCRGWHTVMHVLCCDALTHVKGGNLGPWAIWADASSGSLVRNFKHLAMLFLVCSRSLFALRTCGWNQTHARTPRSRPRAPALLFFFSFKGAPPQINVRLFACWIINCARVRDSPRKPGCLTLQICSNDLEQGLNPLKYPQSVLHMVRCRLNCLRRGASLLKLLKWGRPAHTRGESPLKSTSSWHFAEL